jgi:RNA polymerase sigma-70 factor (ECF subfamily)
MTRTESKRATLDELGAVPAGVLALDISDGQITSISSIVNPDKLTHLGPVADFRSLPRSAR